MIGICEYFPPILRGENREGCRIEKTESCGEEKMRSNGVLACLILFCAFTLAAPSIATEAAFPWKAGDNPPLIAGIALGDTEQHVLDVLGEPTSTAQMGAGT